MSTTGKTNSIALTEGPSRAAARSSLRGIQIALLFLAIGKFAPAQDHAISALPLEIRVPQPPQAFTGSDRQQHLAFEVELLNLDKRGRTMTLGSADFVPATGGDAAPALLHLEGPSLKASLAPINKSTAADQLTLPAGNLTVLYVWISISPAAPMPTALRCILHTHLSEVSDEQTIQSLPIPVAIGPPFAFSPPFAEGTWAAVNGPSNSSEHRRSRMVLDGRVYDAQRFAIDFIKLTPRNQPASGSGKKNEDYPGFGVPVLAVTDGIVADLHDNVPENVPGSLATPISLSTIAGNFVLLDLGKSGSVAYCHLQPGSLRVHSGQQVKRGDVLGLLGNTGNSDAPHLHLQLTTAPSVLLSEGIPFLFSAFTLVGTVDGSMKFTAMPPQELQNALPLENTVIAFNADQKASR